MKIEIWTGRNSDALMALSEVPLNDVEVLFCRPWSTQHVADSIDDETLALEQLEIPHALVPLEPIVNLAADEALVSIPERPGRRWLYRGWMLDPREHAGLEEALHDRGEAFVVDNEEMATAHQLPEWAPLLGTHTARSRWTEGTDVAEAWDAARELGSPPWIVKDHVKSAKELWHEACLVPAGSDREDFVRVCNALLDARGDRFEGGFVIRELLPLAELPYRMPERPVHDEHRLFVWEHRIVAHSPYHDVDTQPPPQAVLRELENLLRVIDSRFFTADIARLVDDTWKVIELNDGGMSTMPAQMDPRDLYRAIFGDQR